MTTPPTPHPPHPVAAVARAAVFNISAWSIDHPWPVIAFYVGVVILAILAIGWYMPRRMMPYVESPMVGVVSMMPGLSAKEMETYFSMPIEQQMQNVKHLHYLRSASQDGFSIVSLEFDYGTDMKKALFDVQSLMNVAQANLPATGANLKPSWVLAIDPLNVPVLSLALTGDDRWTPAQLRELADNEVSNRLKTVANVYSVVPFGGYRRQLQVIVDRDKLAERGLSITAIRDAIDGFNVAKPAGTLTSGPNEAIVRVDTSVLRPDVLLSLPLKTLAPGDTTTSAPDSAARSVQLKDVATVDDTVWERRSAFHYVDAGSAGVPPATGEMHNEAGGTPALPAIEVAVLQDPDASSPRVVAGVQAELKAIEAAHPGVHFQVAYDNAHFVGILFHNMFFELGLAILLTGLMIFLFLGEWRGTIISLTTIPVSMAMAVLLLIPLGMSLNSSTLIGLLVVIGRLVDDSIIDIHAVERHLRMGKDPRQATIDGITEVRLAVIASTLMLCLALAPLLFCGGIVQLMFVGLVWPIIFGLLSSMVVSFTLTSIMAAKLLRAKIGTGTIFARNERGEVVSSDADVPERGVQKWYLSLFLPLAAFQRFLESLEHGYERLIRWMLQHRFVNMARVLATIIIGFGFYYFIGSEMMPLADVGQAYGALEMQPGTSFAATEAAVKKIEALMQQHPEIEKVATEIGAESAFESTGAYYTGYAMPSVNAATFMLTLSDKDARKQTIWQVIDAVQRDAMATIPGIRRFQIKEMGADVMASSAAPVQLLVFGPDLQKVADLGKQVANIAKKTPGLYQVGTSWDVSQPSYELNPDPARAGLLGLSVSEVADQAYYALHGGLTNEFWHLPNVRQDTILVRYKQDDRAGAEDLAHVAITAPDGQEVPLNAVATVTQARVPSVIEHDGLRRAVSVTGYYRPGSRPSMDLSMDVMMKAQQQLSFPRGYGIEVRGDMTQMMDSFKRLLIGLSLALIFIYLVLVAQFGGFLQPLQMLFSLPLELSGVFIALFLMHQAFSTVSILGVIVLTGMDITTAILLIDLIMRYRRDAVAAAGTAGVSPAEARAIRDEAVATACPQRLRPILMTSVITIIALAPVAFFPRTGMDAYSPLGTAVVGGLIVGTVLSLLDIPILHTYVDDVVGWLGRLRKNG